MNPLVLNVPDWTAAVTAVLVLLGSALAFTGSLGLLRLSRFYDRMHAPTLGTTLGIGSALIASVVFFAVAGEFSIHEVLIAFFLFLTAPITAHFVAKAYMLRHRDRVEGQLPDTRRRCGWSTYDPAPGRESSEAADPVDGRG